MIRVPQLRPTSSWKNLRTALATSISGCRMLASRITMEFYVRLAALDPPTVDAARCPAGRPAWRSERVGVLRKRRRSGTVEAAVAERVAAEQAPAGEEQAADGPSSRIDSAAYAEQVGSYWQRRGEGRRDQALVGADRATSSAVRNRFTWNAPARRVQQLGERAHRSAVLDPSRSTARRRPGGRRGRSRARASRRSESSQNASLRARFTRLRSTRRRPCGSPRRPSRDLIPRSSSSPRKGVEHEEAVGVRVAVAIDAVELAAAREGADGRPAALEPSLRREALAALAAPALEDRAAAARAHPRPEPVGPGPLALLRLIGPLHREPGRGRARGQGRRAVARADFRRRRVLRGACSGPHFVPAGRRLWSPPDAVAYDDARPNAGRTTSKRGPCSGAGPAKLVRTSRPSGARSSESWQPLCSRPPTASGLPARARSRGVGRRSIYRAAREDRAWVERRYIDLRGSPSTGRAARSVRSS